MLRYTALLSIMLLLFYLLYSSLVVLASHEWIELKYDTARTGYDPRSWIWHGGHYIDYNVSIVFRAGLCIASNPVVADVDGDGVDDIVFPSCDGNTYAIHGGDYRVLWRSRTGLGLVSPAAADLNNDGVLDIVVPGPGVLYALNGRNGEVEWSVKGLFYKASPGIADVDCDKSLEVVANTIDGEVAIISANGSIKTFIRVGSGEVEPPALGDVNGDGCPDIVVAENHYVHVISWENGSWSLYTISLKGHISGYPSLYDIDGDGVDDILCATSKYLYAIDYKNHRVLFRVQITGDSYSSPSVGDVDADGVPEIVLATTNSLYIFSLNGSLLYQFRGINAAFGSAIISDIDGDGVNEIIVARYDGEIDVVDLVHGHGDYYNGMEFAYVTNGPLMAPAAIGDVDGDHLPEIIIGSRDFNLYVIDGVISKTSSTPIPGVQETNTTRAGETSVQTYTYSTTTTIATTKPITKTYISISKGPGRMSPSINYEVLAGLGVFLAALILAVLIYYRRS